jgi:alkylated DNA repair protein (DNA oxidative demethylase)
MVTRMPQARVAPAGLTYLDGFLAVDEERRLLESIERTDFHPFVMRGQAARRSVRHYGFAYSFDDRRLGPSDPIPDEFLPMRERLEAIAGLEPGAFQQALVTRYPPGATIGWHRDAPPFGPTIAGVSFRAACRMRFRRVLDGVQYVHDQVLEPRSAYILADTARSEWEHSIPPTKELRYSVTFRTLKADSGPRTAGMSTR